MTLLVLLAQPDPHPEADRVAGELVDSLHQPFGELALGSRHVERGVERDDGGDELLEPAIDLIGRVQDSAFQLLALGREFPLVTARVGRDQRGQFADIAVGEWAHGEIRVRVELEYEEPIPGLSDVPPGGKIALFWGDDLQARAELELARRGMDPRQRSANSTSTDSLGPDPVRLLHRQAEGSQQRFIDLAHRFLRQAVRVALDR